MSRRYELTDQEWEQIALLLPPENTGKPGRPSKDNRLMLNAMIWLVLRGGTFRNDMGLGQVYIAAFANG